MDQSITTASASQDLYELNLAYLFCLREMARKDVAEAAVRFGIEPSMAQAVAESSLERIRSIADPSMLQFKMRASTQMRSLIREGDGPSKLLATISLLSEAADNE